MQVVSRNNHNNINIEEYRDVVKRIAFGIKARSPASVEIDDLIQVGMIGLMDAFNRYKETGDAKFETYASARIRGAMLDELRKADWSPRQPRSIAKKLDTAMNDLRNLLGRHPVESEMADFMGISLKMYQSLVDKGDVHRIIGLNDFFDNEGNDEFLNRFCIDESQDPLSKLIEKEFDIALDDACDGLTERQRFVIDMFKKEITLKEIGILSGVSESRVCQIYKSAVLVIREALCRQGLLEPAC